MKGMKTRASHDSASPKPARENGERQRTTALYIHCIKFAEHIKILIGISGMTGLAWNENPDPKPGIPARKAGVGATRPAHS
jgi:hypothetical protein